MCGLTQHAGLAFDVKDHRVNTRTVILNPILSWLYIKLEYHIEHHMYPQVPWYNLPKLHKIIKDRSFIILCNLGRLYHGTCGYIWCSI